MDAFGLCLARQPSHAPLGKLVERNISFPALLPTGFQPTCSSPGWFGLPALAKDGGGAHELRG